MSQFYSLTLDTLAPFGNTITATTPVNGDCSVRVTSGDNDSAYMYLWVDNKVQGDFPTDIVVGSTKWIAFANNYTVTASELGRAGEGALYVHGVFMDHVGNISQVVDSNKLVYDVTNPTIKSAELVGPTGSLSGHTTSVNVNLNAVFNDIKAAGVETSGIKSYKITGNIPTEITGNFTDVENETSKTADVNKTFAVALNPLTTQEGDEATRTVKLTVYDAAGNEMFRDNISILLDTVVPEAVFDMQQLRGETYTTVVNEYVTPESEIHVIIEAKSGTTDLIKYKLYGDFVGSTEA